MLQATRGRSSMCGKFPTGIWAVTHPSKRTQFRTTRVKVVQARAQVVLHLCKKLFDRTCANKPVWPIVQFPSHAPCAVVAAVVMMALYSPREGPCLHFMRSASTLPASRSPWATKGRDKSLQVAPSCVASPHRVNAALAESRAPPAASKNITWHQGSVQRRDKEKLLNQVRFRLALHHAACGRNGRRVDMASSTAACAFLDKHCSLCSSGQAPAAFMKQEQHCILCSAERLCVVVHRAQCKRQEYSGLHP